jgi:predicted lysophospholipase L1 biosynthesis ABC-type transport system permease subunit
LKGCSGFSFFIIAAAVMLTMLLFKLGVEQRAAEVGLMLALGLGLRRVSRLLLVEGTIVAAIGAAVGTALGVGYAWLMLAGLRTLWLDAVTVPFLTLYVTPKSLAIGYVTGVVVSLVAIWWSLCSLRRLSVRRLMANQRGERSRVATAAVRQLKTVKWSWGAVLQWARSSVAALPHGDVPPRPAVVSSAQRPWCSPVAHALAGDWPRLTRPPSIQARACAFWPFATP